MAEKINLYKRNSPTLAVSSSKKQPKRQTNVAQSIATQRAQGKENKERRSLAPIPVRDDISDSKDDKPLSLEVLKKSAVKRLPFSNSPVKRNALVVTQA